MWLVFLNKYEESIKDRNYLAMKYREAWNGAILALGSFYSDQEVRAIVQELFFRLLGVSPDQRVLRYDLDIPEKMLLSLQKAAGLLKQGMPVQYVTGVCTFMDIELQVSPDVLIPRPETEELVQWVLKTLKEDGTIMSPRILDIGTGSGCIAIALASAMPDASIAACDNSGRALGVATKNGLQAGVRVDFFLCDILDTDPQKHFQAASDSLLFDCIVSNPPYVRRSEKVKMHKNVLDFEPPAALFVDDNDPLVYYRGLCNMAASCLKSNGLMMIEINEHFAEETVRLLEANGFSQVEVRVDIHGKDRFIKAIKKAVSF